MRTLLLIITCFFATKSFSQPPLIEWQRCYGGTQNDIGYSITCTSDGGYIFNGCTGSIDGDIILMGDPLHGSNCDYWYAKIDVAGSKQFKWNPGGTASDVGRDAYETPDGGYIIAGGAASTDVDVWGNHGDEFDFWVIKLNSAGDTLWKKCYGGNGFEDYGKMDLTQDGGFIFCAGTASNNGDVSGN